MSDRTAPAGLVRPFAGETEQWISTAIVGLAVAFLLIGLQLYLQNVHIATTNGLWKSIDVRRWIADTAWHRIDFANVLYFPVQAVSCELLERLGVFPGQIWRQLAVLNGLFGGIGAAAVYIFTLRWLSSRAVAVLTAVLYSGSGFYLLLSVINEDIMPGAVLILIASLLACGWFVHPTARRIAVVAIIFSLAWLWEWRLIFPSLPAMTLALFVTRGRWWARIVRPMWFVVAMSLPPLVIALLYRAVSGGDTRAAWHFFLGLFWAGKGVGTGWGGFTTTKVILAWTGVAESIVGARNVVGLGDWHADPVAFEMRIGTIILLVLAVVSVIYAWRNRRDPHVPVAVSVLGGTLLAGTVFNLYSQPQDPQMVINVMVWTVPGWALLANTIIVARPPRASWRRAMLLARPILVVLVLWPLWYNISALAEWRGLDRRSEQAARELAARFDLAHTVFLYQGFEGIATWQAVMFGGGHVEAGDLPASSAARPDFKYLDVTTPWIIHPEWTGEQVAADVRNQINTAIGRGYRVVAGPIWLFPDAAWSNSFATIAKPGVSEAVRAMVTASYRMEPAFKDSEGGTYSLVSPRHSS